MLNRIATFVAATLRDAPIVGHGPYLSYRFKSWRGNKTPMPVTICGHDIQVRPATPDLRVAFQSLRKELDILRGLLPSDFDGVIIDAGGYIGTAALKLSAIYPRAQIVTIEPSETNFAMLRQNTDSKSNIHPINAALTATSGKDIPLFDRGTGDWGFSITPQADGTAKDTLATVTTVTLEDVHARFPGKSIGLVKLDIEGAEFPIFKDPTSVLRTVPAVFAELHDRIVPGCSAAFEEFNIGRWVVNAGGEKHLSLCGRPDSLVQGAQNPEVV